MCSSTEGEWVSLTWGGFLVCMKVVVISAVKKEQQWRRDSQLTQLSSNNTLYTSPHLLPTQVHPQPSDLSTHKLLSSFASLWPSPPPPHSSHTSTLNCRCVRQSFCTYTSHGKLVPTLSPFPCPLLLLTLSFILTSTYSQQAWEHNPLNERIWFSKIMHKSKTSKLTTFAAHQPFTIPARMVHPCIHPPSCS